MALTHAIANCIMSMDFCVSRCYWKFVNCYHLSSPFQNSSSHHSITADSSGTSLTRQGNRESLWGGLYLNPYRLVQIYLQDYIWKICMRFTFLLWLRKKAFSAPKLINIDIRLHKHFNCQAIRLLHARKKMRAKVMLTQDLGFAIHASSLWVARPVGSGGLKHWKIFYFKYLQNNSLLCILN